MGNALNKRSKLKLLIRVPTFIVLAIISTIVLSPYFLGMEFTDELLATIMFRVGFVFWGAAIALMILCRPAMSWLNAD